MKLPLFIILNLLSFISKGQTLEYDNYRTDTIFLKDFSPAKVVSYKFDSATFYVDYEDYKNEFLSLWKTYRTGVKEAAKAKKKGRWYNDDFDDKWPFIDSVYSVLMELIKAADTIYLSHEAFLNNGLSDLNDFFPNLIEKRRCAITNSKGERQTTLIKKTGNTRYSGGRRYFLIGHLKFFVEATDWET